MKLKKDKYILPFKKSWVCAVYKSLGGYYFYWSDSKIYSGATKIKGNLTRQEATNLTKILNKLVYNK